MVTSPIDVAERAVRRKVGTEDSHLRNASTAVCACARSVPTILQRRGWPISRRSAVAISWDVVSCPATSRSRPPRRLLEQTGRTRPAARTGLSRPPAWLQRPEREAKSRTPRRLRPAPPADPKLASPRTTRVSHYSSA
jgi:hypothetical protein